MSDAVGGLLRVNNPQTILFIGYIAVGATGAPTLSQNGSTAVGPMTITRTGVGLYTGTFPPMAAGATSLAHAEVRVALSAVPTVSQCTVTAFSATAGTFGFTVALNAAATAVEAANGDVLVVKIWGGGLTAIF
jgi:hypothetical protein